MTNKKWNKALLILCTVILFILMPGKLFSQSKKVCFSGIVKDAEKKEPIAFASIFLDDLQIGAISDEKGNFRINGIPKGVHNVSISFLGYVPQKIQFNFVSDTTLQVYLVVQTLELDEVSVIATPKGKSGSAILIDKTTMEFIQPTSLSDIMQLLPGQLTQDGTLTGRAQITSRQAGDNANTALGTAIVGDGGVPLSNNANLQNIPVDMRMRNRNTVNRGVDLRMLSTDHIETAEVVQGIPSAEYGDLSSGMILSKAKSGKQPLEMRVKANPNVKLFYVGKGVNLPEKWGALHGGLDYTDARPSVRETLTAYKRYSMQLNYTNIAILAEKPLQFGIKMLYMGTLDATKNDPDLTPKMDTYKATYNRMQVSGNWIWRVAKPWLNSLEHSISYDYTQDVTSRMLTVSPNGVVPLPTAETDGEHEGVYLPAEYFTSYKMTGVPTAFFSQLKGKNIFSSGKNIYHVLNWGGQYRHEKNRGKGFEYDLLRPPYPTSSTSSRPRRFNEIPALQNLSVYIEDKVSASFGKNNMELIAGVRFTHMPGIGNRFVDLHQKWFPEPRINGWWQLSNFQCLGKTTVIALKGGYGEAIKFPTLDMLHPEPDYLDHISLNYYSQKQANALLWITTKTNERSNPALKPNRNRKAELGLNIQVGKSKLNVLCFYEKSSEGFQYNTHYYWYEVNKYRSDILFDYKPQISEFQVYKDSLLDAYSVPVNGEKVIKKGVEYMFSTPVIKPLATSILVNGAYYQTVYDESLPIMSRPSIIQNGKPYRYVGVYGWNRGKTQSRFNTNVWFNTHLKKYRLIFTTKLQSLWFTHYTTLPFSGVPIAYFGVGMDKPQEFTEADKNDPTLRFLVQEFSSSFFKTTKQPLQIGIDLKATKEITGELRMSFYVNRLMFCSPLYYSNLNTPLKIRRTPYFGIEIEIKL